MDSAKEALIEFIASLNKQQLDLFWTVIKEWDGDADLMLEVSEEYIDLSTKLHDSLAGYRQQVLEAGMPSIEDGATPNIIEVALRAADQG